MEARGHALLDRRTPLAAAPPRRRTLRLIAGGVIGATLEVLALRFGWFDRLGHVALLFLPAYYLVVAVHELGHLAAALFVRFEWREFSTDPLVVRRKAARIRWRFVPARLLAGGQVQAVPPDALNLRRRFLILLAGGPIATALVFAALAPFPWTDWSTAVCVANLLAAATSWLPYYTGGYVTDEKAILLLSGGSAEGELLLAILRVMALDTRGVRPRDWGAETIARLRLASESTLGVAASILLLSHALDGNDGDAIAEEVERALPRAGGGVPPAPADDLRNGGVHARDISSQRGVGRRLARRRAGGEGRRRGGGLGRRFPGRGRVGVGKALRGGSPVRARAGETRPPAGRQRVREGVPRAPPTLDRYPPASYESTPLTYGKIWTLVLLSGNEHYRMIVKNQPHPMTPAHEIVRTGFGGFIERRGNSRFPLREEVRYKLVQGKVITAGAGTTINFGSGGILFTTEHRLPMGRTIELSVNWPARLDGTCALKFVATGRIIRSEDGQAAVRIDRYEFRTRSSRTN
jgi:hypothetical protein